MRKPREKEVGDGGGGRRENLGQIVEHAAESETPPPPTPTLPIADSLVLHGHDCMHVHLQ